ncbi:CAMK protein kinase [Saprolegnia parasitica CBS 223.65]|uniref:CAMK protein kinase n=1 Tax=Saprolegnia parasitica (strain CBS 223.65) TaxID=695850 RepID=A0A067BMU4_SAPPC|nr:CAMK protein kinase [Saprolegnia parasitica CBS 223.65]KDO19548.1 CAMK protein kinase [Saprolegnia parasitica CBS 223.65]|eukprot:XP_012209735.1 CAMK protein kinase [Saprolegnia parasitica CBS 223.65]
MRMATRHSSPEATRSSFASSSSRSSSVSVPMLTLSLPDVSQHPTTTAVHIKVPELHGVLQERNSSKRFRWLRWKRQKTTTSSATDCWVDFDGDTWRWFPRTGPGVYKATPTHVLSITPLSRIDVATDGSCFQLFDDGQAFTFYTSSRDQCAAWTAALEAAMVAQAFLAKYHLGPVLGSGGSASVHSLVLQNAPTDLVVKLVIGQKDLVENEIAILCHLSTASPSLRAHVPTLVKAFDLREQQATGLVLPRYDGGSLHDRMRSLPPLTATNVASREAAAKRLMRSLLRILELLHGADVLHLDLKPANILFKTHEDDCTQLVLIDFGLAMRPSAHDHKNALHDAVRGTPGYLAPELLSMDYERPLPVSSATDVFSAGVLLYNYLLGVAPFQGATKGQLLERMRQGQMVRPQATWALLSVDAQDFVMSMLQRKPHHRASTSSLQTHPWLATSN